MAAFPPFFARAAHRVMPTALLLAAAWGLAACSSFDSATRRMADAMTFYKPEVVQGNFISSEQVAALRPGMTRLQVRDILGTPLMASVFHADRWDYVFTMQRQRVAPQHYRLTLHFQDDLLARFEGDDMPSETEFVERISRERKVRVPVLEATDAQLERFAQQPVADAPDASATEPQPRPPGTYPPLE
ncbi:MAG: outer membrane protein assembly factor BamE [Pseudomonadota bacterium]|nr:outer membrane protein assembly factor BamE [Pseudomonadota bacterium]